MEARAFRLSQTLESTQPPKQAYGTSGNAASDCGGPSSRATDWVGRVRVDRTYSPGSTAVPQLASLVVVRCCRGHGELRIN